MNIVAFVSLDNTHWSGQAKKRLSSRLIKGIRQVFQKLLQYFNVIIVSTFFVPPAAILPVIFCLNLKEALLLLASEEFATPPASVKAGFVFIVLS